MIDPIFAAPRRQEGFASEKQKLLEDCRRRLSKMATFFKRWTGCVLFLQKPLQATNPWPAIRAPDTSQSSGESCDFGISNLLGCLLGPASAAATLSSCGKWSKCETSICHEIIKKLLAPLLFTKLHWLMSGKRPDVQVPTKERSWVGATWHLFQFPRGQLVEWIWKYCQHE